MYFGVIIETANSDTVPGTIESKLHSSSEGVSPEGSVGVPRIFILGADHTKPGPGVIKLFSCSIQLSMKFYMLVSIKISRNWTFLGSDKPRMLFFSLINVKMPTIVGILTFISRKNFMLS